MTSLSHASSALGQPSHGFAFQSDSAFDALSTLCLTTIRCGLFYRLNEAAASLVIHPETS